MPTTRTCRCNVFERYIPSTNVSHSIKIRPTSAHRQRHASAVSAIVKRDDWKVSHRFHIGFTSLQATTRQRYRTAAKEAHHLRGDIVL